MKAWMPPLLNRSLEIPTKKLKQDKGQCVLCPRSKDNKTTISCIKCNSFTCKKIILHMFAINVCRIKTPKEGT